jgi:hypothetical protein
VTFLSEPDAQTSLYAQFHCRCDVIVSKIVMCIEEVMMKCMYGKRIIVAMGYGNMKELSMLQVFDKAYNSVNYTHNTATVPALHFVNSTFQNTLMFLH